MKFARSITVLSISAFLFSARLCRADEVQLSSLDLSGIQQDTGKPQADKSAGGNPISIGAQKFDHGIGVNGTSKIIVLLDGGADHFSASVGVDDDVKDQANVLVSVSAMADGVRVFPAAGGGGLARGGGGGGRGGRGGGGLAMRANDLPQKLDFDVKGVRLLELDVTVGGGFGGRAGRGGRAGGRGAAPATAPADMYHVDWADAKVSFTSIKPQIVAPSTDELGILTPPAPATPRINGAHVFGVHPGHQVLYAVAATGDRPMQFSADNLPGGLTIDSNTGRLIGSVPTAGEYNITLHAKNAKGSADGPLKLVVGDTINLTPQMGWNSWNCFGGAVKEQNIKDAADAMVKSGLINHGWSYINIDDFWEVNLGTDQRPQTDPTLLGDPRAADGTINPNKRFSDMKGLTDYVHSLGLRAGLYSSPGPTTCGGCTASYQHEEQDVNTWAKWGFDYIKYDWCSYGQIEPNPDLAARQKPYQLLADAIKKADRDIVFSFCQYGAGNVWEWGAQTGGNSWRTTGDITATWNDPRGSVSVNGFDHSVGLEKYAGPGHWNDPDMLVVGSVDIGSGRAIRPTALTPNEQYTHISLWCLLDSPLLIGCDMTKFDDFTTNLLSNDEVIAVSQDPLGKQAGRVVKQGEFEVWAKDMSDGSKAVGLFNRSEVEGKFAAKFSDLKITGDQNVRDLWRQKDLGKFTDQFEAVVPRHGVVLVKISPVK